MVTLTLMQVLSQVQVHWQKYMGCKRGLKTVQGGEQGFLQWQEPERQMQRAGELGFAAVTGSKKQARVRCKAQESQIQGS